jgi:hypothetical protein
MAHANNTMKTTTTEEQLYNILIIRSFYGADDALSCVSVDEQYRDDLACAEDMTLEEATEAVENSDNSIYHLAHNEAGRAELLIVPLSVTDQILSIYSDGSNADWSDYEGEDNDEEAINAHINDCVLAIARGGATTK